MPPAWPFCGPGEGREKKPGMGGGNGVAVDDPLCSSFAFGVPPGGPDRGGGEKREKGGELHPPRPFPHPGCAVKKKKSVEEKKKGKEAFPARISGCPAFRMML